MVKTILFRRVVSGIVILVLLLLLPLPALPAAAAPASQAASAWDVTIYLGTPSGQVKVVGVKPDYLSINEEADMTMICFPGQTTTPDYSPTDMPLTYGLALNASGKMNGTCKSSGTQSGSTGTYSLSGSLSGQVTLKDGTVTFTGSSDYLLDVPGEFGFHAETHFTYTGTGKYTPAANGQPTEITDGALAFKFHDTCDKCYAEPVDLTYTDSLSLDIHFWPSESVPGIQIQLDRTEAARFGAIKLSGSGFKPKVTLKVMFGGEEIYRVDTLPNGAIPDNTWIWVPDDLPFGPTQVWVEQVGGGDKTPPLDFNIIAISRDRLVQNFDAVVKLYLAAIPTNDRWYAKLRSGRVNNFVNATQTGVAFGAWLATTIATFGYYQADLWPGNKYVCSWYQAEVLDFFDKLRFNPDPTTRALLDGFDYGPFNSGYSPVPAGSHFFVILWPHGPALDPALASSLQPTWDTAGVTFDPWPKQAPDLYEINQGSASWAATSTYSMRWQTGYQYGYAFPRIEPPSFNYYQGDYPITGGTYYNPKGKGSLALDYRKIVGIGNEPPKMVAVHSPVTLEFEDDQGHKAGMDANGQLYSDIPTTDMVVFPKPEGGYEWYVALPQGDIHLTITGTGDGSYQLMTKSAGHSIQAYPQVAVKAGETATLTLTDDDKPVPLHTAAGQDLLPTPKDLPAPLPVASTGEPSGTSSSNQSTLFLVGGVCCIGLLLAGVVVVIILLVRRKRSPQAPQTPPAQPNPPASPNPPAAPAARQPAFLWIYQKGAPNGGYWFPLPPNELIIGSQAGCGLVLDDPLVSPTHARLFYASDGRWYLVDLKSAQGLWVNGQRVSTRALKSGDQIQMGQSALLFRI